MVAKRKEDFTFFITNLIFLIVGFVVLVYLIINLVIPSAQTLPQMEFIIRLVAGAVVAAIMATILIKLTD